MCGRFSLVTTAALLSKILKINHPFELPPRYNIAPSQPVAMVRFNSENATRELAFLRWGLIPSWSKAENPKIKTINAQSETVYEKPMFRGIVRRRRCLIPADGFYEWKTEGKKKQPYYIQMQDQSLFAFAGLWDRWEGEENHIIESCTILTTTPNQLMEPIHTRMPVIVHPQDYDLWLDLEVQEKEQLQPILRPYPAETMTAYPVGASVNRPTYDNPQCREPLPPNEFLL